MYHIHERKFRNEKCMDFCTVLEYDRKSTEHGRDDKIEVWR